MRLEPDRALRPAGGRQILLEDEVHVWSASLDVDRRSIEGLRRGLSQDERDRAERYRSVADKERFLVARGLLRRILGRYLGMPPDRLQFCYGPYGKPSLASDQGAAGVEFSVSHSGGLALCAITLGRRVGIDLEQVRPIDSIGNLVDQYFSSSEREAFRSLSPHQQLEGFYRCWTRKEAFVKAKGAGLTFALDRFDVSLAPGEPARVLAVRGDSRAASRWALVDLETAPGYVGAVAVEGHGLWVGQWHWAG